MNALDLAFEYLRRDDRFQRETAWLRERWEPGKFQDTELPWAPYP